MQIAVINTMQISSKTIVWLGEEERKDLSAAGLLEACSSLFGVPFICACSGRLVCCDSDSGSPIVSLYQACPGIFFPSDESFWLGMIKTFYFWKYYTSKSWVCISYMFIRVFKFFCIVCWSKFSN
jgi:hypothetical protein